MKQLFLILAVFASCSLGVSAQTNQRIRELERKQSDLKKQIADAETLLKTTNRNVSSQLEGLYALSGLIKERQQLINAITEDIHTVDAELNATSRELAGLRASLKEKRANYKKSVRHLYKRRNIQEKLLFVFSANTLSETYRRMRYVREYATYQRLQGNELIRKQQQVSRKAAEFQEIRSEKNKLLAGQAAEKMTLEAKEKERKQVVKSLQSKQRELQNEIAKRRREANRLNAQIDKLVEEELEKARKLAEAEARKEKAADSGGKRTTQPTSGKGKAATSGTAIVAETDRKLSSNFASNRGKLPMPITGTYIITTHYGQYAVDGLKNVRLDNKGIDIQGKKGAQARAIFNGKVAAVFKYNGLLNILVRHGSYISVYCNLASASVKQGDTVTTKQTLGVIAASDANGGNAILHFQLRKEKDKLNPEVWLAK